jgi:hypothetical protein
MTVVTFGPFTDPTHNTAARGVLDALSIGDQDTFAGLSVILRARLTPLERRALAWAALRACDDEEVVMVAEAILPREARAGWPVVPLEDVAEEAAFWADHASPAQLRAYAVACFANLPPGDQGVFSPLVQRRAAA